MPYFATFDLSRLIEGEYSLVEFTINKDSTLLLALTDLALATGTDEQVRRSTGALAGRWLAMALRRRGWPRAARTLYHSRLADRLHAGAPAQALLARVQRAVDAQVERVLSASSGIEPWIRADREVWELQRWQPFVGWGSSFPGHLYPGERRWVRRDLSKRTQAGFSTDGWRLDPTVVTADGWSYALVPQRLRARQVKGAARPTANRAFPRSATFMSGVLAPSLDPFANSRTESTAVQHLPHGRCPCSLDHPTSHGRDRGCPSL
jgi:hypothetical protein